mgnify:CR=1 FL=1
MKKIITAFCICLVALATAYAQGNATGGELVTKRIADAISSGKFYMKFSAMMTGMEEDGMPTKMMATSAIAVKGKVSMTRMDEYNIVHLAANGFNYLLNEKNKTYSPQPVDENDPQDIDFGKLTFKRQGTCKLNGTDYYWDEYLTSTGHTITFYYNSDKVAAIDLGTIVDKGMGVLSLLSFDVRIPENMYLCLGRDWKKETSTGVTAVDINQYIPKDQKIEGLPEGVDLNDLMSEKGQKDLIRKMVKKEDLPEGMDIDDIMDQMGQAQAQAQNAMNSKEMREALKQSGMSEEEIAQMTAGMPEQKDMEKMHATQKAQAKAANAPAPPVCSTPWKDNVQSNELAANDLLGEIIITDKRPKSPHIYLADFAGKPTAPPVNLSMDVTDEGVWRALEQISQETKGMTNEQAKNHLLKSSSDMMVAAELRCVTGEMIERAVANCMACPSSAVYNNTGLLFFYKGDTRNALQYYQTAEKADTENVIILTNIAECFLELGEYAAARRYASRAITLEPEFGPAYQILTTLHLQEGNSILAAETLFKCARYYFSDVTASQFFSLKMALIETHADKDFNIKGLLDKVFSPANLDLLTLATKAGFTSNGQDTPANQKTFAWPVQNASIQSNYVSLEEEFKKFENHNTELHERNRALMEKTDNFLMLYEHMGIQNAQTRLKQAEGSIKAATSYNLNMPNVPDINAYAMASMAYRKGTDGSFLLDARQFWCLDMWYTYYDLLSQYWRGDWTWWDQKGGMHGCYPPAFKALCDRQEQIREEHKKDIDKWGGWIKPCYDAENSCLDKAESESERIICNLNRMKCCLPHHKRYVRELYKPEFVDKMDADKAFYTSTVQPVLEEWWLKMNAMTAYCDNLDMQEYFLTQTMCTINEWWQHSPLIDGKIYGKSIDEMWNTMVVALEAQIGLQQSIVDQMPANSPKPAGRNDIRLKNYGEKDDEFAIGPGIPTPFGRLGLLKQGDHYIREFHNEFTNVTTRKNLTTGEETSFTTYKSLADEQREQESKSFGDKMVELLSGKAKDNVIDRVGKGMAGIDKFSKCIPSASSSSGTQSIRTVDSQGNVVDTGMARFRKYKFGGGGVGAEVQSTEIRTGNGVRTKNHIRFNFGFFDIQVGK